MINVLCHKSSSYVKIEKVAKVFNYFPFFKVVKQCNDQCLCINGSNISIKLKLKLILLVTLHHFLTLSLCITGRPNSTPDQSKQQHKFHSQCSE